MFGTVWHVRRPALVYHEINHDQKMKFRSADMPEIQFRRTVSLPVNFHVVKLALLIPIANWPISHFDQMYS